MAKLHFDIRDIFRVIRLGWSGKKIWVGLCGLIIAYAGYSILVVLAHLASGTALGDVWRRYGLFPGAACGDLPLLGTAIHVVGMLFALAVVLMSCCMICKITYQQLRGDDFYSSGDAWKFLKGNWSGVILGPVAVLALFVFFMVVGIVIGYVAGWIPWVGELAFAVSFIPIFFAALVAIFTAVAFIVAFSMSPAIVGTVGEDSLEVVIQSFSLAWSQPWRLVLYSLWMKISVGIGATLLGGFMASTLWLIAQACALGMGQKLANMLRVAGYYVPCSFIRYDIGANLPAAGEPSGTEAWAGRILAIMLILLAGVFISYVQSACASGSSLIYVILRKRKDDENLLEWEDETLDDETPLPAEPEKTEETPESVSDTPETTEGQESEGGETAPDSPEKG